MRKGTGDPSVQTVSAMVLTFLSLTPFLHAEDVVVCFSSLHQNSLLRIETACSGSIRIGKTYIFFIYYYSPFAVTRQGRKEEWRAYPNARDKGTCAPKKKKARQRRAREGETGMRRSGWKTYRINGTPSEKRARGVRREQTDGGGSGIGLTLDRRGDVWYTQT